MTGATNSVAAIDGVSGAFIGLCTVIVAVRFFVRWSKHVPLGADDWCMLILLPFLLAYFACVIVLVHIGWIGRGVAPYPAKDDVAVFQLAAKITVASDVLLFISLASTKASALLLYRRIFCGVNTGHNRGLRYLIYGTLAILPPWVIVISFLAGFQCGSHLLDSYETQINTRYCGLSLGFIYAEFVSDLILDVWVMCLPIPYVLRLHAKPSHKAYTIGLFLIALVAIIASVLRLVNFLGGYILDTIHYPASEPEDISTTIFFYNVLELGMSVVSINMVVLGGILTKRLADDLGRLARGVASLASSISLRGVARSTGSGQSQKVENAAQMPAAAPARNHDLGFAGTNISEVSAAYDPEAPPVPREQAHNVHVQESFSINFSAAKQ